VKIEIINKSRHGLPEYITRNAAGMDIRANIDNPVTLAPLERALIPTGLHVQIPVGYEAQIRPRSGLAIKHGISMVNSPGTVDSDYRGEINIILVNLSREDFVIEDGDRIGQMIITRHEKVEWIEVKDLSKTEREKGGFGHTGQI
jgi:dUTP pyrophosphatase